VIRVVEKQDAFPAEAQGHDITIGLGTSREKAKRIASVFRQIATQEMAFVLQGIRGLGGTVLKTNVDLQRAKLIQDTLSPKALTISLPPSPLRLLPAGTTELPGGSRTHGTIRTFARRTSPPGSRKKRLRNSARLSNKGDLTPRQK
jgi:hypothetical protein